MATIEEQLTDEQKQRTRQLVTHSGPGASISQADPETGEALKALVAARAAQAGLREQAGPIAKAAKAEPKTSGADQPAGGAVDQDVLALSVQSRAQVSTVPGATSAVWWFSSAAEGEISTWWSAQRDQDLRDFWMREGNDILQGAVTSMVKKFRAMNWRLDGPEEKVSQMQAVLANVELGQGWSMLLGKVLTDYLTQDQGAFMELIGEGDPDGPMDGLPTGVAHLDAGLCQLTGDPVYPVLYRNTKQWYCPKCNKKYGTGISQCPDDQAQLKPLVHRLHATRVVHIVDMPSPNEAMKNVGFCALSRVIASSYVLLKLAKYKNEKLSDLPQAGLLLLNNILPKQWEDVTAEHQRDRRRLGQELWSNIMVLMGIDPEKPVSAEFLNFAQLPDAFNEEQATNLYINIVALAFGVDVREFWPLTGGNLGTATETLVMHQKAKGKGVGDLISTLERAINWHILPEVVTFRFDFTDDDEDLARATLDDVRAKTILSMYLPDPNGQEPPVASRDEVRQMLADNVSYFLEDFLETDVTSHTQADDTDVKAMYGRHITIDHQGRLQMPRGHAVLEAKKGGPGSGHYGHAGRPGEVGGSAPGTGGGSSLSETDEMWMDEYAEINRAAWSGRSDPRIQKMDEAVRAGGHVPEGTVVYRGVSLDPARPGHQYVLQNLRKGFSFHSRGFSSVTDDSAVAEDFAAGGDSGNTEVIFELTVAGKCNGANINSGLSETVLDRNLTYKIDRVSRRTRDGVKILRVAGRVYKI